MPSFRHATIHVALLASASAATLALSGCSAQPEAVEQSLTVGYADGGDAVDATVNLPAVDCSDLAGTLLFSTAGENGSDDWGLLRASATPGSDAYTISIGLGDDLWFISTNAYDADATRLDLDSLEGIVAPVTFDNGVGDVGESLDTAATASGSIDCTDD